MYGTLTSDMHFTLDSGSGCSTLLHTLLCLCVNCTCSSSGVGLCRFNCSMIVVFLFKRLKEIMQALPISLYYYLNLERVYIFTFWRRCSSYILSWYSNCAFYLCALQVQGAKARRQLLCNALGIDNCTGSALITVLNRFFTRQQYNAAVCVADVTSIQEQ